MQTTRTLADALIEAKTAALAKVEKMEDGGTCNFDSCVLFDSEGADVELALQYAGLTGYHRTGKKDIWAGWFIHAPRGAQGCVNTAQAEAIHKILKDKGFKVGMYYQMD